jgi:hypothetical protein
MIVNQNGESSKSTKRKTTDHQQEQIKEYEKNRTRIFLPKWAVGRPWLRDEANLVLGTVVVFVVLKHLHFNLLL